MAIESRPPSSRPHADRERGVEATLPEPGTPEFDAEAHRQSLRAARSPHAKEDTAFVESLSDWLFDSPSDDD